MRLLTSAGFAALLFAGCATSGADLPAADGVIFVASAEAEYPLLRYRDGQLSANTSCMIQLQNPISRRIPPMYVNGRPLGFC
ncbi:MAG: hypothetical protein DHS20C15_05170 [Planctomycetota bacterium]|nr:MAG: hypothetical protein DHS20C15_05170 [Planctomycetota bacterium]